MVLSLVAAGALASCSIFTTVDGLSGEHADPASEAGTLSAEASLGPDTSATTDASSDGASHDSALAEAQADVASDAATNWCKTSQHYFCDDFDEGLAPGSPATGWDDTWTDGSQSAAIDTTTSTSLPASFVGTIDGTDAGPSVTRLMKRLPSSITKVHVAMDVFSDFASLGSNGYLELFSIGGPTTGILIEYRVGGYHVTTQANNQWSGYQIPGATSGWVHLDVVVNLSLTADGSVALQVNDDAPKSMNNVFTLGTANEVMTVAVGPYAANFQGGKAHYDNVTIDVE